MTNEEKAQIILEGMDKHMQIDWNLRKLYVKAIIAGLEALEKEEEEQE